ncbi:hypothetical protein Dimus_036649 [Dionaea muscipula]
MIQVVLWMIEVVSMYGGKLKFIRARKQPSKTRQFHPTKFFPSHVISFVFSSQRKMVCWVVACFGIGRMPWLWGSLRHFIERITGHYDSCFFFPGLGWYCRFQPWMHGTG